MRDHGLDYRRYVIAGVTALIVVVYIIRLFTLQITSDDYKKSADSNAFLKKIEYPSRGVITDRNGKLLVYNQPAYDIMVVMNEAKDHLDTLDFCAALNITREEFDHRMETIKDRSKNPGYSRFTQQLFMSQLSDTDFSVFQEKMFHFPGFYVQRRSIRQYQYPFAAHVLGDVAEVSKGDIEEDDYYQSGDYIGKLGVERSYEKQLRGEKGKIQGYTRDEVSKYIKSELINKSLCKDPIVTVSFTDMTFSVLGSAGTGVKQITKDRITLLEALAMGDLNLDGMRQNVLVMRQEGDEQVPYRVDLTSAESVYNSPVYFIRQNDIIYVEPNDLAKRNTTVMGNSTRTPSFWIGLTTSLISMGLLIWNLVK